jgi:hypothetical protein
VSAIVTRETGIAKIKALAARQSTQILCEALVTLAAQPNMPETRMTRAVMLDVLCERHPEADAAAEAWAESDSYDMAEHDAAVIGAALTAIGA